MYSAKEYPKIAVLERATDHKLKPESQRRTTQLDQIWMVISGWFLHWFEVIFSVKFAAPFSCCFGSFRG